MTLKLPDLEFKDPKQASVAVVEVPRAAKMAAEEAAAAAAAPAAEGAAAPGAAAAAPAAGAEAKKEDAPKKEEGKKSNFQNTITYKSPDTFVGGFFFKFEVLSSNDL